MWSPWCVLELNGGGGGRLISILRLVPFLESEAEATHDKCVGLGGSVIVTNFSPDIHINLFRREESGFGILIYNAS